MLTSLALIFLLGLLLGQLCVRLRLPALLGYVLAGIALGGSALNALSPDLLAISADLRRFALVVILLRAGLTLKTADLRRAGRPALLLCFVPACCEIAGCVLLAPLLLGCTPLEGAVIGSVLAAVSPAVVVPRMIALIEQGRGAAHAVPQMVLAGASADDVFVIVVFTAAAGLCAGGSFSPAVLLTVPVSIALGALAGLALGRALAWSFPRVHLRDSYKVVLLLGVSFLLLAAEDAAPFPFSGLLAILGLGLAILHADPVRAARLSAKLNRLWAAAELLLFALVGAAVDLPYAARAGAAAVALVALCLVFRMAGVALSVARSALTPKERLFAAISYCPKATVQAAIGGTPLAMGLACGADALTVAVISILLTAPLGALAIDRTAGRLLDEAPET